MLLSSVNMKPEWQQHHWQKSDENLKAKSSYMWIQVNEEHCSEQITTCKTASREQKVITDIICIPEGWQEFKSPSLLLMLSEDACTCLWVSSNPLEMTVFTLKENTDWLGGLWLSWWRFCTCCSLESPSVTLHHACGDTLSSDWKRRRF